MHSHTHAFASDESMYIGGDSSLEDEVEKLMLANDEYISDNEIWPEEGALTLHDLLRSGEITSAAFDLLARWRTLMVRHPDQDATWQTERKTLTIISCETRRLLDWARPVLVPLFTAGIFRDQDHPLVWRFDADAVDHWQSGFLSDIDPADWALITTKQAVLRPRAAILEILEHVNFGAGVLCIGQSIDHPFVSASCAIASSMALNLRTLWIRVRQVDGGRLIEGATPEIAATETAGSSIDHPGRIWNQA